MTDKQRIKELEEAVAKLAATVNIVIHLGEMTSKNMNEMGRLFLDHIKHDAFIDAGPQSLN